MELSFVLESLRSQRDASATPLRMASHPVVMPWG